MLNLAVLMDNIDNKILTELGRDSRQSTSKIARKTGIPQTTVHFRIKKMVAEEVIEKYTILLNREKIGKSVMAFVLVLYDTNAMKQKNYRYEDTANGIRNIPGVEEFAYTTGQYDIVIKVTARSMKELSSVVLEQLRRIPGVFRTETIVVLDHFSNNILVI